MSFRRHLVWSAALHELARDRVKPTSPNALSTRGLKVAQAADSIRALHATPLTCAGAYDRQGVMTLAVAYARRDRLRDPTAPWSLLMRSALKHAWARARREREIGRVRGMASPQAGAIRVSGGAAHDGL